MTALLLKDLPAFTVEDLCRDLADAHAMLAQLRPIKDAKAHEVNQLLVRLKQAQWHAQNSIGGGE